MTDNQIPLKSIHDRKCLTKCYPKGEIYIHPILLTAVKEPTNNSCAINPVPSQDDNFHKIHEMIWADTCNLSDNTNKKIPNELESMLFNFQLNSKDFLTSIYNLNNFNDVIYWTLENDYLPFDTIKRVHNSTWSAYGSDLNNISNIVVEYYYEMTKNYWLKDYINGIQNDYSFNFVGKNLDVDDSSIGIYDIILEKYYTYHFLHSCIKKYIDEWSDKWDMIYSHYDNLKKYIYIQLVELLNEKAV